MQKPWKRRHVRDIDATSVLLVESQLPEPSPWLSDTGRSITAIDMPFCEVLHNSIHSSQLISVAGPSFTTCMLLLVNWTLFVLHDYLTDVLALTKKRATEGDEET